jgi:high-affinity iron transporter
VNLLDYIAADYSGAVSNGKILSASEYQEQNEFVDSALETATMLSETRSSHEVLDRITALKKLIQQKASAGDVAREAQAAKTAVIQVAHIELAPTAYPSVRHGRELFEQSCAACHGVGGHGDGPAAASLDPKPANFFDEKMAELSPFKAFNVIRVGVPGTAMAAWNSLSDQEAWDLAFYVVSLRHQGEAEVPATADTSKLKAVASLSDRELLAELPGTDAQKHEALAKLRLQSNDEQAGSSLQIAVTNLDEASDAYHAGQQDAAKTKALKAYLEGVEPVEPRLRATSPEFVSSLEQKMAAVRASIQAHEAQDAFDLKVSAAKSALDHAGTMLKQKASSPWLTLVIAAGILLREGFEAVLILIALLAVIRAAGSRKAALWVHAGWVAAVGMGVLAWFFSGWLMGISGAQRELMEGATSILAVLVLLYMGFWLHSRTEIHRWKQFIDGKIKTALQGGNLYGLAAISFMAVFREAFETVLFLRAVWLDGGDAEKSAMALGVFGSFIVLLLASWALLKYSARIPIRKVFSLSSVLMIALALILAGKGIHALQETGLTGVTAVGVDFHSDLFGIFPTLETLLAQAAVLIASAMLWLAGKKPPARRAALSRVEGT